MEVWAERVYHIEAPERERRETKLRPGRTEIIEMMPEKMTWKSLINNGLCMGKDSPCVTGSCEVMCGYGRRYLKEKEQHAG